MILPKKKTAFLRIKQLRREQNGFYQDFKRRADQAEKDIKALQEKSK